MMEMAWHWWKSAGGMEIVESGGDDLAMVGE